jgi:hypothetical protein
MNNVSSETIAIISLLLVFIAIIAGMVFRAVKAGDKKTRFQIIGRIIWVAALVIAFAVVWLTSK